ncbi:hypothetical protein ARAM_004593 [Aspergillus rambellii]|uniref:Uncharacterized protein n=1 Tax=Aspergillus rambellii TaxID=308745 RepID=A0A0F8X9X6_9EURO|nr:hypothetical protein ARAM_004593 [Aspergillus rambellii]
MQLSCLSACCAGIPDHFQNWGDPSSGTRSKPEVKLPENFAQLSHEEQESVQETMRRRVVHFYYAAWTMNALPDHFDAIRSQSCMLRAKLFQFDGTSKHSDGENCDPGPFSF